MRFLKSGITGNIHQFQDNESPFDLQGWIEATQEEIDNYTLVSIKPNYLNSRRNYLLNTDWYALREIDEPGTYSSNIKKERIKARTEINRIEKTTTLGRLKEFGLDFSGIIN